MNAFIASNGWRVSVSEVPGKAEIDIYGAHDAQVLNLLPSQLDALREFFLDERDAELGRWRSKEQPSVVAWPEPEDADRVFLLDEDKPEWVLVSRPRPGSYADAVGIWAVAREFFAAHPEPKPWGSASNGDIWALTDKGGTTAQYLSDGGRFFKLPLLEPREPCWAPAGFASDFTAGRRVHPEVQS